MRKFQQTAILASIALIVALITSSATVAAEDLNSATYLVEACRDFNSDKVGPIFRRGRCSGVISALAYVSFGISSCPPRGVTHGQQVKVVVSYIDQRPARLHEDFRVLVLEAIRAAWPCKR